MSVEQLRNLNLMTRYAPEGDDGDGGDGGDAGGGGKDPIAELQSKYDTDMAELRRQLKEASDKLDNRDKESEAQVAQRRAAEAVANRVREIDAETDADKALALSRKLIDELNGEFVGRVGAVATLDGQVKSLMAEKLALTIQFEHGGDVDTYKTRLLRKTTREAMEAEAKLIELEVKAAGNGGKRNGNNGGNGDGDGGRRQVDAGRGSASRTNLLNDMKDIDVTTPEGRAEWEKKRAGFKQRIEAAAAR